MTWYTSGCDEEGSGCWRAENVSLWFWLPSSLMFNMTKPSVIQNAHHKQKKLIATVVVVIQHYWIDWIYWTGHFHRQSGHHQRHSHHLIIIIILGRPHHCHRRRQYRVSPWSINIFLSCRHHVGSHRHIVITNIIVWKTPAYVIDSTTAMRSLIIPHYFFKCLHQITGSLCSVIISVMVIIIYHIHRHHVHHWPDSSLNILLDYFLKQYINMV